MAIQSAQRALHRTGDPLIAAGVMPDHQHLQCQYLGPQIRRSRVVVQPRAQPAVGLLAKRGGVLADLCEAVIGAIYLDAGWPAAEAFVARNWSDRLTALPAYHRDAKSALQEWAQGRGLATPVYRVLSRTGPDHAPVFTMAVVIPGLADGVGEGSAKRQAEIAAATAVLLREGVWGGARDEEASL